MTDGTIFHVMWDVQKAPDGSIISVVDQRPDFIKARLGMGLFCPQVGRLGKTGGVFRIDMSPVSATEPHPNVLKMREYAAAHPRSAEAKVQELERRWDADPLLKPSWDRASAHDRLDAPGGGPCVRHCDQPLYARQETQGRTREVSKDASGAKPVTARTAFRKSPIGSGERLFPDSDLRRTQKAFACVPMHATYSGSAKAMGAQQLAPGEYYAHEPLEVEVEGGGGAWVYGTIRDRIEMPPAAHRRKLEILYECMQEFGITHEMAQRPWDFELPPASEIVYHPAYVAKLEREEREERKAAAAAGDAGESAAGADGGDDDDDDDDDCGPDCWRWGNKTDSERQRMGHASAASNAAGVAAVAPFLARFLPNVSVEQALYFRRDILAEVAGEQLRLQQPQSTQTKNLSRDVRWELVDESVLKDLAKRLSQPAGVLCVSHCPQAVRCTNCSHDGRVPQPAGVLCVSHCPQALRCTTCGYDGRKLPPFTCTGAHRLAPAPTLMLTPAPPASALEQLDSYSKKAKAEPHSAFAFTLHCSTPDCTHRRASFPDEKWSHTAKQPHGAPTKHSMVHAACGRSRVQPFFCPPMQLCECAKALS